MKRLIAFRACLAAQTLQTVDLAFNEPESRVFALLQAGSNGAAIGAAVVGVLALLALVDLFIDLYALRLAGFLRRFGERYGPAALMASHCLRRRRWLIWLMLAVGYAAQAFVAVLYGFAPRIAGVYFVMAIACASVAWLDNLYRFEAVKQKLRDTGHGEL